MSDRRFDELVRRELDAELTPAEHAELAALCADDAGRQAARRGLGRTVAAARALGASAPEPGPRFSARVMDRLPPAPRRRGLLAWLLAPQPLRLRPLTALGAAAALAVVAGLALHRPLRPSPAPVIAAASQPAPAPAACPAPSETVLVRFVFKADHAHRVALAGDFNEWRTDDIVLGDPQGNGLYSVTVPLKAGASYSYMFVVDGARWTEDPLADSFRPDGFGRRNSLLRL
ncbi:MAG TPA: isoamylase early set domain-containing protein [Polyangia bacterium]